MMIKNLIYNAHADSICILWNLRWIEGDLLVHQPGELSNQTSSWHNFFI